MNPNDDAIEQLLRAYFDGPLADDGFSERVVRSLPPRRRRIDWPARAGLAVGAVTCWASLQSATLLHAGWSAWLGGRPTTSAIAVLLAVTGMSLLALCWSVAEADGA